MKYIILAEHKDTQHLETPVLFPEWLTHKTMAQDFAMPCVSAGFVKITPKGVVCYDESASLQLKPRPQDAKIIEQALGKSEIRDGNW